MANRYQEETLTTSPVFKGCTRPPMVMGVPLLPMVILGGLCMWAIMMTFLAGYLLVSLSVLIFFIVMVVFFRQVSKADDYRLQQLMDRAIVRLGQSAGRVAFFPTQYDRR